MSKRKVTVTLNSDTNQWVRTRAKESGMSVSSTVERLLTILRLAENNQEELEQLSRIQQNIKDAADFEQSAKLMDNQDD